MLAGCTAVSILSTDLFAPSVPALPEALGTDARTAQLAVSVNLAAYALAQLVHGPLADRFGRRSLLSISFLLFAAVSVVAALSVSVEGLIGARFAQGLFSSVPSVVIVLIIRELYGGQRAVAVLALYGMAVGVAPLLGPLIGGYLEEWFGWRAGFWLIAGLALVALWCFRRLVPETLEEPTPLRPRAILRSYIELAQNRAYLARLAPLALSFGALFAFVTTGPLVVIDLMDVPTERYGLCYGVIILAYVAGNGSANRLASRISSESLLRAGALFAMIGGVSVAVPVLAGTLSLALMLTSMSVFALGLGLIMAAGPIGLLDAVADRPQGPASALLGSCQLGAAALAGFLSGSFYDETAISMVVTIAGMTTAAALPLFLMRR